MSNTEHLKAYLKHVVAGEDLAAADMQQCMRTIMQGQATPAQIGALLTALSIKGESVQELAAAAAVMREFATAIDIENPEHLVDTCGTGGDGAHLFNVSTAAALVAAAAGARIAKHGNRSVSGSSGSADFLEQAGVRIELEPVAVAACIRAAGIGFLFAPRFHGATRHAAGPRRELGFRTLFNLLGPLTNPCRPGRQLVGVFSDAHLETLARVLECLGCRHALVVHSGDGLDELSIAAPTRAVELRAGQLRELRFDPGALGVAGSLQTLTVTDPAHSYRLALSALNGEPGPARDMVALNAAAVLMVADLADDIEAGLRTAQDILSSGAAAAKLTELARLSQGT